MNKSIQSIGLASILSLLVQGCAVLNQQEYRPLEVVENVEINKYMGTWYEIASIPMSFQENCTGTTATYSLNPDQSVEVFNQCFQNTLDGPINKIKGSAWIANPDNQAKLKVQFFWPFSGDYWLIELDDNYQHAVVGHPSRNYLWILSRQPDLEEGIYESLLEKIQAKGYDLDRIKKTPQKTASITP